MRFTVLYLFLFLFSVFAAGLQTYANGTDELMVSPVSASMGGSDLSIGSGVSAESTPANLPFDSLNSLMLSYAGYYQNTFSTSMLSFSGHPRHNIGVSLMVGYVFVPNIPNTQNIGSVEPGEAGVVDNITYFSASRLFFRAGAGRRFDINRLFSVGVGCAVNAKRTRLEPYNGYGLGVDAGLKALWVPGGLSCALQVENVASSYIYWSKDYRERSYTHLRVGIGWEKVVPYVYGVFRFGYTSPDLFANEGINYYDLSVTKLNNTIEAPNHAELYERPELLLYAGKFGAEYIIMNSLALRIGLSQGKIGFGAGLKLMNQRAGLDFAYITHTLAGTYQLSLNYLW